MLLFLYCSPITAKAESVVRESDVQAVLLFNFIRYTQWPPSVFPHAQSPFQLCILGDAPFAQSLRLVTVNQTVRQRKLNVRQVRGRDNLNLCQLLFIGDAVPVKLEDILLGVRQYPVLTVSFGKEFVLRGGMVAFFRQGTKVRFAVNPHTAQKAGLKISANLLQLAHIIH